MAIKQLGAAPSASEDAVTKSYADAGRKIAIPFYISGSLTSGVKPPEFIAPVAMTVTNAYARLNSGSGAAIRPSKNSGTTDGTILSSISTTVVNNSQSVTLAAGDRLALNITTASGSDLSVTFWANIT